MQQKGIKRAGPIGPFMEKELLKDSDLCLNAERAQRLLGWKAEVRGMDVDGVRKVIASYERQGWWP